MIPLSILDLSPVSAGSTAAQALRNSLDLARLADGLDGDADTEVTGLLDAEEKPEVDRSAVGQRRS
jgi:hypothetical protein